MYPDFYYLLKNLFGINAPEWLSLFKTFGLFVALGFLTGGYVLLTDLKRKAKLGIFKPEYEKITIGKPATTSDYVWAAVIGFILGYKGGGIASNWETVAPNPPEYLLSLQGNFLIGLVFGAIMLYSKYREKKKQELAKPEERTVAIYPHNRITEFIVAAMVSGLIGAKIFNALETWDSFIKNPIENLISPAGLTYYGGLITAALVIAFYARKHKIPIAPLADSFALALMISYAVGRLGCQFAGDGDWGIFNSAYVTGQDVSLHLVAKDSFLNAIQIDPAYLAGLNQQFGATANIPHAYAAAPSWLPDWLFAMNYPYNVNNEGVMIPGCIGTYCHVLPVGVFPTPLYEAFTCTLLFLILLALRTRLKHALHLSGIYLIFNGVERFLVETIRVNTTYDWGFIHPTQAEIISVCLVIVGTCILLFYRDKQTQKVA